MSGSGNKLPDITISPPGRNATEGAIRKDPLLVSAIELINRDRTTEYTFTVQEYSVIMYIVNQSGITLTKFFDIFNDLLDPGIYCSYKHLTINGESVLLSENLPPARKEKASSQKAKTYSAAASDSKKKYEAIKSYLESLYKDSLAKKEISDLHIHALSLTLTRVDSDLFEKEKDKLKSRTASRLYDWAKVHATIVYPFISLSDAAKGLKDKDTYVPSSSWGVMKDEIVLPKVESLDSDSSNWGLIFDILKVVMPEKKIKMTAENDSSVPDISESKLSKEPQLGYFLVRLLELIKSPKSATLRRGEQAAEPNSFIRNCVDFYVLDKVRSKFADDYDRLQYYPTVGSLRRQLRVPIESISKKGTRVTQEKISYVGYKISEIFCSYLVGRTAKNPENEPVSRFFFSILDTIVDKWESDDSLPSALFLPVNTALRRKLRQGPMIENKKRGISKANLYIPFSFVKASECARMPEVIKKSLTSLGSEIIKNLDTVNSLSVKDQNLYAEDFENYITISYSQSDEIRKMWRTDLMYLQDTSALWDAFITNFPEDISALNAKDSAEYFGSLNQTPLEFVPLSNDASVMSSARLDIEQANERRKAARKGKSP